MPFENNVFINCPFDNDYDPLLKSMVFCLIYLGYEPLISNTISSNEIRINKIKLLIRNSRFGIHDISRKTFTSKNLVSRFNMPFELGMDIGCQEYGEKRLKKKKTLVLDSSPFEYDISLSDISGQDIAWHSNNPWQLTMKIRDWFSRNNPRSVIPLSRTIWTSQNEFSNFLSSIFTKTELEELQITDFIKYVKDWLRGVHNGILQTGKKPRKDP